MNLNRGFQRLKSEGLSGGRQPPQASLCTGLLTKLRAGLLLLLVPLVGAAQPDNYPAIPDASKPASAEIVRGLIRPVSRALLSSELRDRIKTIGFRFGERFRKGDLLVAFDCSFFTAELAAKQANFKARQAQHRNNRKLLELHAISEIEVEISAAHQEQAAAEQRSAAAQVKNCTLVAPFDGAVDRLYINEHESVAPSQELLSILSDKDLEIELIVPSHWLGWITAGARFKFVVDETGSTHAAKVDRVGVAVDPVSQTVRLIARFGQPVELSAGGVLAGMSGQAQFERQR